MLVTAIDLICAQTLSADNKRNRTRIPDYSNRTGLPKPLRRCAVLRRKTSKSLPMYALRLSAQVHSNKNRSRSRELYTIPGWAQAATQPFSEFSTGMTFLNYLIDI